MKTEKEALNLRLPIKAGEGVEIKLMDGKTAVAKPIKIVSAIYQNAYLYVTFETKNSIYKDVPVQANPKSSFYDGQILAEGEYITTQNGDYLTISHIVEINNKGIIVKVEENKQMMHGEIELY